MSKKEKLRIQFVGHPDPSHAIGLEVGSKGDIDRFQYLMLLKLIGGKKEFGYKELKHAGISDTLLSKTKLSGDIFNLRLRLDPNYEYTRNSFLPDNGFNKSKLRQPQLFDSKISNNANLTMDDCHSIILKEFHFGKVETDTELINNTTEAVWLANMYAEDIIHYSKILVRVMKSTGKTIDVDLKIDLAVKHLSTAELLAKSAWDNHLRSYEDENGKSIEVFQLDEKFREAIKKIKN